MTTTQTTDPGERYAEALRGAAELRRWLFADETRWPEDSRTVAAYHPGPDYGERCEGFAWPVELERGIPSW